MSLTLTYRASPQNKYCTHNSVSWYTRISFTTQAFLGEKMQILNTAAVLGLQAGVLDGTEVR